jgi:hypothetical protein
MLTIPPLWTVTDFCAPEAEFPSAKSVGVNRDPWPRTDFVFEFLQVRRDPNPIDCLFGARERPLDSATLGFTHPKEGRDN